MKQEINRNEWIDAYLKGELPANEAAKVKELIATDADFAREVETMHELHDIVRDSSLITIKEELSSIHTLNVRNEWLKKITGYGTGAIIAGLVIFYFVNNKPLKTNKQTSVLPDTSISVAQNIQQDKQPMDIAQNIEIIEINTPQPSAINAGKNAGILQQVPVNADNSVAVYDTISKPDNKTEKKDAEPKKEIKNPVAKELPKAIDCSKVRIKVSLKAEESCNDNPTGTISIIKETVKGGTKPYLYSLNKKNFSDSVIFHNLASSIYSVYVKDGNNCIVKAGSILVGRKQCTPLYQEIFAPLNNEIWEIPVKQGVDGIIKIFTKNGNLVYTARVSPNDPNKWNGENMNRQILPMGVYQFVIKYNNGEVFVGNITIKK